MEMGPRLKVLSDRLVKPVIKPETPGLQGKQFIHYTTAAPEINHVLSIHMVKNIFNKFETFATRKTL